MKFVTPTKIAGLALAAALMATASQAADKIVLKYADQFPLTHTGSKLSAQPFKKMIEERSNGAIEVQLYPAEQLAKAAGLLDGAVEGVDEEGRGALGVGVRVEDDGVAGQQRAAEHADRQRDRKVER